MQHANTLGFVDVTSWRTEALRRTDNHSTFRSTSSLAKAGKRSTFPSAHRYSMERFPFDDPHSNPGERSEYFAARPRRSRRTDIATDSRSGESSVPAADEQSAKSMAPRPRSVIFFFMFFSLLDPLVTRHLTLVPSHSDHPIRPEQHRLGNLSPICFAVFRLITSSNFVGCSTGMLAGLVPLRILSTIHAARR